MLSDDKNINSIEEMFREIKTYINLEKKVSLLALTEKLSKLLSAILLLIIALILGTAAYVYLSVLISVLLEGEFGKVWAMVILSGFQILLLLFVYCLRRIIIYRPVVRFVANLILKDNDE